MGLINVHLIKVLLCVRIVESHRANTTAQ